MGQSQEIGVDSCFSNILGNVLVRFMLLVALIVALQLHLLLELLDQFHLGIQLLSHLLVGSNHAQHGLMIHGSCAGNAGCCWQWPGRVPASPGFGWLDDVHLAACCVPCSKKTEHELVKQLDD